MNPELITNLAPAGVYLVGLVAALKHIAKLYESRLAEVKDGHEARFELLEQSAKECYEDRNKLRGELSQIRLRLLQRELAEGLGEHPPASPEHTSEEGES